MKKNVVLIICDAVNNKAIDNIEKNGYQELFLTSLKNRSIYAKNCYSQAPYTEGAVMGLYGGVKTLDFGGYLETLNTVPSTILREMEVGGYETYFNSLFIVPFTRSYCPNVKNVFYSGTFNTLSLYNYRFSYYSNLYKENALNNDDFNMLERLMNEYFTEWLSYLDDWKKDNPNIKFIKNITEDFNFNNLETNVVNESNKFFLNPKDYIVNILKQEKEHVLFKDLGNYPLTTKKLKNTEFKKEVLNENNETITLIRREHKKFVNKLKRESLLNVIKNIFLGVFRLDKKSLKKAKSNWNFFRSSKSMNKINQLSDQYDNVKYEPSFSSYTNHFINWYKESKKDKPFFACMHLSDTHSLETFFDYDSSDKDRIRKQFNLIKNFISQRKDNSSSLLYDLSILYCDNCLKELVDNYVNNGGSLEDTVFIFTSDHGSFSSYNPVRDRIVNNFYLESYHVPLYIFGGGLKPKCIENITNSFDVPATILDIGELNIPLYYSGKSLLHDGRYEEFSMIEFLGPGCPDLKRRPLWLSVFDKNYMVATFIKLDEDFNFNKITEVYDLNKDPLQKINLVIKKGIKNIIAKYLDIINNRLMEIKGIV